MKTWISAGVVALAIVFHALFPRYEFRDVRGYPIARVDRWTGQQEVGAYSAGMWVKSMPTPRPTAPAPKDSIQELRELIDGK